LLILIKRYRIEKESARLQAEVRMNPLYLILSSTLMFTFMMYSGYLDAKRGSPDVVVNNFITMGKNLFPLICAVVVCIPLVEFTYHSAVTEISLWWTGSIFLYFYVLLTFPLLLGAYIQMNIAKKEACCHNSGQ
jgi:hypothetical protein